MIASEGCTHCELTHIFLWYCCSIYCVWIQNQNVWKEFSLEREVDTESVDFYFLVQGTYCIHTYRLVLSIVSIYFNAMLAIDTVRIGLLGITVDERQYLEVSSVVEFRCDVAINRNDSHYDDLLWASSVIQNDRLRERCSISFVIVSISSNLLQSVRTVAEPSAPKT